MWSFPQTPQTSKYRDIVDGWFGISCGSQKDAILRWFSARAEWKNPARSQGEPKEHLEKYIRDWARTVRKTLDGEMVYEAFWWQWTTAYMWGEVWMTLCSSLGNYFRLGRGPEPSKQLKIQNKLSWYSELEIMFTQKQPCLTQGTAWTEKCGYYLTLGKGSGEISWVLLWWQYICFEWFLCEIIVIFVSISWQGRFYLLHVQPSPSCPPTPGMWMWELPWYILH